MLDACALGWADGHPGQSLIVPIDLLHLFGTAGGTNLDPRSGQRARSGGVFAIYGPFMRDGALTGDGDRRFHQDSSKATPRLAINRTAMSWLGSELPTLST